MLDQNFDNLVERFEKNVYGGIKGTIRLAVLERDINTGLKYWCNQSGLDSLRILDVGAGLGQLSIQLAKAGHNVTVNDISEKMLVQAKSVAKKQSVDHLIQWIQCPYQSLPYSYYGQFDLVLCHALMEWLAEPEKLIPRLSMLVSEKGLLSLTCYNQDALVFKNLLKGNFNFVDKGQFAGDKGSLTPLHPQRPLQVKQLLESNGWQVQKVSGIRVFNDFSQPRGGNLNEQSVLKSELDFASLEPYKWLGRYIHFLCSR